MVRRLVNCDKCGFTGPEGERHECLSLGTTTEATKRGAPSGQTDFDLLSCEWRYDSYNDQMITKCKESWPGYKSVEMKFCFNCGKKIKHASNVVT